MGRQKPVNAVGSYIVSGKVKKTGCWIVRGMGHESGQ
jgi:hypothetical protein